MKKLSLLLLSLILLGGCMEEKQDQKTSQTKPIEVMPLKKEKYKFLPEKKTIKQNDSINLAIHFDPAEKNMENMTEVFEVYQDANMSQSVANYFEYDKEKNEITILPPRSPIGGISSLDVDSKDYGFSQEVLLFYDLPNEQWGRMKQLYLVTKVDLETGDALDQPLVQIIEIEQEISESLQLKFELDKEGLPVFKWNSIESADYYYIVAYDYNVEKGLTSQGFVQEKTSDDSWTVDRVSRFQTFKVSELDRNEKENIALYGEGTDPIKKDTPTDTTYAVVGVNKNGTTAISNLVNLDKVAGRIPLIEEVKKNTKEEGSTTTDSVKLLPSFKWITMCDGTLQQRIINYDFSKAKETNELWGEYEKDDFSDLTSKKVNIISIPYQIDGTSFKGLAKVSDYDNKTWQSDLEKIEERQNKLRVKGGYLETRILQEDVKFDQKETSGNYQEIKISATTNLSYYLANEMLAGKKQIDISEYAQLLSNEVLFANFQEAMYQNPLILGVKQMIVSNNGDKILVEYEDNQKEFTKKQKAIQKEVKKVVNKIIKTDMSDLEKEFAINAYLIDTAAYDEEASKNAEKFNYSKVDNEYNDSFTPYGVLINHKGVCASYAGAFKLLADEAELESIVVTGFLNGEIPHAWNKVKINDEWQVIDSTNNDNEFLLNSLLNVPEKASEKILQEDTLYLNQEYVLDYKIDRTNDSNEYYHVENKFFETNKIVKELVEILNKESSVTLRTDYQLDDEKFYDIYEKVSLEVDGDISESGFWNGVVYFKK